MRRGERMLEELLEYETKTQHVRKRTADIEQHIRDHQTPLIERVVNAWHIAGGIALLIAIGFAGNAFLDYIKAIRDRTEQASPAVTQPVEPATPIYVSPQQPSALLYQPAPIQPASSPSSVPYVPQPQNIQVNVRWIDEQGHVIPSSPPVTPKVNTQPPDDYEHSYNKMLVDKLKNLPCVGAVLKNPSFARGISETDRRERAFEHCAKYHGVAVDEQRLQMCTQGLRQRHYQLKQARDICIEKQRRSPSYR